MTARPAQSCAGTPTGWARTTRSTRSTSRPRRGQRFVPDLQGSIIASLNSGAGALTKTGYLPYGGSASSAGTFRYTGQRIDAETGLYYYRARMYSPTLGRFVQVDPIGSDGGVNLYAYVFNDPMNLVDPFGLAPDSAISGVLQGLGNYASNSLYGFSRIPGGVSQFVSSFLSDSSSSGIKRS